MFILSLWLFCGSWSNHCLVEHYSLALSISISNLAIRRLSLSLVIPQIGPARFRAPELLFRPDLIGEECEGLHEVLVFAIQKSDMDLRRTLFSNIVLSGGSTLFKGSFRIFFNHREILSSGSQTSDLSRITFTKVFLMLWE